MNWGDMLKFAVLYATLRFVYWVDSFEVAVLFALAIIVLELMNKNEKNEELL